MEPDYSNYSAKELKEALASIDKMTFPERTEKIRQALSEREKSDTSKQKDLTLQCRWSSTSQNVLSLVFFGALALLSYSDFLDKNLEAVITFITSVICSTFSAISLFQKSGWVRVDEEGVSYQNIWGRKKILWDDISCCYIGHIRFTKLIYLVCKNGKKETLPIVFWKQKEIYRAVNARVERDEA